MQTLLVIFLFLFRVTVEVHWCVKQMAIGSWQVLLVGESNVLSLTYPVSILMFHFMSSGSKRRQRKLDILCMFKKVQKMPHQKYFLPQNMRDYNFMNKSMHTVECIYNFSKFIFYYLLLSDIRKQNFMICTKRIKLQL